MSQVARVVVDVTGVDKTFDYLVPDDIADQVSVGTRVRVPLHRREVSGWVLAVMSATHSEVDVQRLLPIARVTSLGPSAEIVALIEWAAHRYVSRLRPFFVSASPTKRVPRLVEPRHAARESRWPTDAKIVEFVARGGGLMHSGLNESPTDVVQAMSQRGTVVVVAPTISRARAIAAESRRRGLTTALYPEQWASAASGVDIVVGARSCVWASVPNLGGIVVVDEHDDTLQEERAPTWHAREIATQRALQASVPCVLFSPVPTIAARVWAADVGEQRSGLRDWPDVEIVDRASDERQRSSLVTSRLIEVLRNHALRVVCVLNVKGRARTLACDACRAVARCETCGAAVTQPDEEHLRCLRCSAQRPIVCLSCGSQRMRSIRVGVSRLRDELEKAAGRAVQEVTATTSTIDPRASVYVGTEAVLHRIDHADVVVFLDIDSELLAPRFRASEQALDLIVHGARIADLVLIQTAVPDHEVLRGVASGDLSEHVVAETKRRRELRLPPFAALAEVSGAGVDEYGAHLSGMFVQVAKIDDRLLVRADSWDVLSDALAAVPRGKARVRIAVDPVRS